MVVMASICFISCGNANSAGNTSTTNSTKFEDTAGLSGNESQTTADPEKIDADINITDIALGITPEQFLQTAAQLGMVLNMPDYTDNPIPEDAEAPAQDGRIYNYTDYSFYYSATEYNIYFTFTPEGALREISVWDAAIPTAEGLAVGDSIEKMESIYGTDHAENVEGFSVFQYKIDEYYLNIFFEDGFVIGWKQSIYANINND